MTLETARRRQGRPPTISATCQIFGAQQLELQKGTGIFTPAFQLDSLAFLVSS